MDTDLFDSNSDSDSNSGSDTSSQPVVDTETTSTDGSWEWLFPFVDEYMGVELYDIYGTGPDDLAAGGWTPNHCVLQFNGVQWSGVVVDGCDGAAPVGVICGAKDHDVLWTAPTMVPNLGEWDIFRRQSGIWSTAPQPSWWLSSYRIGHGGGDRPLSCLPNGEAATLIYSFPPELAWLAVFQGSDWIIVHDFNLESDGTPYTVFGTSAEELVVFSYPSSTGGVFISYGDVVSLSLPQFGVTGSNDNGYGVRGITGDLGNGFFAAGWWKKSPEVEESGFVWRSSDLVEWEEMEDVPHVEDSGLFSEHFWDACLDDQGILYVFGDWYDSVATAEGESNAVVLKRDGAEWVVVDLPPIPDAQPGYEKRGVLYGAWCPGRHVFAAGVTYREGTPEMAVLHYTPPEDL